MVSHIAAPACLGCSAELGMRYHEACGCCAAPPPPTLYPCEGGGWLEVGKEGGLPWNANQACPIGQWLANNDIPAPLSNTTSRC